MKKIVGYILFTFWALAAIGFAAFSIPVGVVVGFAASLFLPSVQESLSKSLSRQIGMGHAFIGLGISMVFMIALSK